MYAPIPASHFLPSVNQRALPSALLDALQAHFGERCSTALVVREQHGRDESPFEVPPPGAPIAYRKLRARGAIDYPQLLTAVQHIHDTWRCVVSAVGPAPLRLEATSPPELVEAAMAEVQPLTTHLASPAWRKKLVRVELARAMAELGIG